MTAFNVVRFRVKPGKEEAFIALHRETKRPEGARQAHLIKTGDRTYCFVGEWNDMSDIVAARPAMIGILDAMRDLLEDLGGGLGVTDPVSGPAVAHLK
jgi:quinol monooxygenase YgiN